MKKIWHMESNRLIFSSGASANHQSISLRAGPYTRWGGDRLRGSGRRPVTAGASLASGPLLLAPRDGGPGHNSREKTQHGDDQLHTKAAENACGAYEETLNNSPVNAGICVVSRSISITEQ